jgi:hypothetical protein
MNRFAWVGFPELVEVGHAVQKSNEPPISARNSVRAVLGDKLAKTQDVAYRDES